MSTVISKLADRVALTLTTNEQYAPDLKEYDKEMADIVFSIYVFFVFTPKINQIKIIRGEIYESW